MEGETGREGGGGRGGSVGGKELNLRSPVDLYYSSHHTAPVSPRNDHGTQQTSRE